MRRCWFGFGLLLALLFLGLLVSWGMGAIQEPVARDLAAAGEAALAGDWEQAENRFRQARENWEKWEVFRACFADHGPMEELDGSFARLEVWCRMKEKRPFAALCAEAVRKVQAIGEAHALRWETVF